MLALEHCSTRLRFKLIDRSKVNQDALKKYKVL
ncbi:PTS transporter subunit EIIB [Clostridioides difficile]|nr:PTS transporter subunit EIIB [Clostridioides difficile]